MQQTSTFQVYNASAGSGKTFTLVKEYLKILLQSPDKYLFQKILAITFTNKAAAEMKERVLKNLEQFSEGKENELLLKLINETALDEQTISTRSRLILEAILQNYSAFAITTIDSFTHKIIKSFAFDLGLNLNFEVETDAEELLTQAVDVLISKIGIENDITNVLIDYSLDKVKEDSSWDISYNLNEFAKNLLKDKDAKYFKKLSAKTISDFTSLKKKLIQHQKEIEKEFIAIGKDALALIEEKGLHHAEFSYGGELPNHFKKLTNYKFLKPEDLKFNGRLDKTIEENKNLYASKTTENSKQLIDEIKEQLEAYYYSSKELYESKNHAYQLNKLILKSIIPLAVLTKINSELTSIKEENNIQLISEFNQLIATNIKEEPVPFIYERIGQKFMHYFIDEMQDTSVLQWQNLIPLIDNALSQEQSNLLLVGDGKQAIYRWRGGKAEQFIQLGSKEQTTKEANPFYVSKIPKTLEVNFRSYSEVVNFNNQFFQHIANYFQNPMYRQLFVDGNNQHITDKKGGFVSIDFLPKVDDKEENQLKFAKKVHGIIVNLDKGYSRKDVCVLVRKNKEGVEIANYLSEKGIEIVSSETLLIKNSKKVQFIIDLLQVILHPKDEETWINVFYFLHEHLKITVDKHNFLASFDLKKPISFYKEIERYNVYFNIWQFEQLPFYEKIEEIIRAFHFSESSDAYLQFFLDVVFERQKKGTSIQQFLDFWHQKKDKLSIVAATTENAVQIMTIHKSKGLEFPVVIYPYDIDIYYQNKPKAWLTNLPQEQFNGFEEFLVSSEKSIRYTGTQGEKIYNKQREELELDNFNLLYVAYTRAIEQLYIVTEKDQKANYYSKIVIDYLQKASLWSDEKSTYTFGSSKRVGVIDEDTAKGIIQKEFISNSWKQHHIYMVANSSKFWGTRKGEAIEHGNLVHEILSKVVVKEDVNSVILEYIQQGIITVEDSIKIKELINKIVNHSKLAEYYSNDVVVYNEREIVSTDNQIIIPDRLVFNSENEATIIDYKTGLPSKKYHQQLNQYENVLASMQIKVIKKILIYINEEITIDEI